MYVPAGATMGAADAATSVHAFGATSTPLGIACKHSIMPLVKRAREGVGRRRQNAGTSSPLNWVSMKLLTSGDW